MCFRFLSFQFWNVFVYLISEACSEHYQFFVISSIKITVDIFLCSSIYYVVVFRSISLLVVFVYCSTLSFLFFYTHEVQKHVLALLVLVYVVPYLFSFFSNQYWSLFRVFQVQGQVERDFSIAKTVFDLSNESILFFRRRDFLVMSKITFPIVAYL